MLSYVCYCFSSVWRMGSASYYVNSRINIFCHIFWCLLSISMYFYYVRVCIFNGTLIRGLLTEINMVCVPIRTLVIMLVSIYLKKYKILCLLMTFSLQVDKLSPCSHYCVFLNYTWAQNDYKCYSQLLYGLIHVLYMCIDVGNIHPYRS